MRRAHSRLVALLLGGLGASIALTACGSSPSGSTSSGEPSKPASQIVKDAVAAMQTLSTVHLAGNVSQSGQNIGFNFVLTQSVGGGSMTLNGSQVQVVDDGSNAFIKGGAAFWQNVGGASPSFAKLIAGHWVTGFSAQDLKQLAQFANLRNLVGSFQPQSGSKLRKQPTKTFDGVSALPLKDTDGSIGYVAATGPPYILGLQGPPGQGLLTFNEFNTAKAPTVPTNAVNFNS